MLGILDLLGTIGGNVLSLPGILGLALGMMTRNWMFAAVMGGFVGIAETLVFAGFKLAEVQMIDLFIAVLVGVLASSVGCAIRHKGATV
ncbi:hypothetical protein [Roseibium album]|uniref:Uncharacterized protein n=1 Tax=Roseibium album TaxID=311410 RepID=A0A0M6ZMN9_9HYPH|nr:hypothetical protein [Roseibium album]CTQ59050.1 hypothetical protein LA5094_01816 [Roseibium album]CTQ64045.1 hypothetical protein LA5096_00239 [Roseibium album]CTQ73748.1 hypothetical protein LA5095_02870 [Roseibium album]